MKKKSILLPFFFLVKILLKLSQNNPFINILNLEPK